MSSAHTLEEPRLPAPTSRRAPARGAPPIDAPEDHRAAGPRRARLYLVNPTNPAAAMLGGKESLWNRFRVWQPLGLMVIAGLTPDDWETTIIDENLGVPDYSGLPRPDLVGITAFTSQAPRAYELASRFRAEGIPVVLGGIHATMCTEEASAYADSVVTGEAESVWAQILADLREGRMKPRYEGGLADMSASPPARHDLLPGRYPVGSIQTTRGCPLKCSFCSVTAFNGARFRQRPISHVIDELRQVPEKFMLIVDDNLIGTGRAHVERAKELFRAMIEARLKKLWFAQATVNVANDDELLALAAAAGCRGFFIGFESPRPGQVGEIARKNGLCSCSDLAEGVRRIQRRGILVAGSFIIGLDTDEPGIGALIADTAEGLGVDMVNVLFLTPLPGTRLWDDLLAQDRISLQSFPEDWSYYTLTYPVARYGKLTLDGATDEMLECSRRFYAMPKVMRRLSRNVWHRQSLLIGLIGNLSYRRNIRLDRHNLSDFRTRHGRASPAGSVAAAFAEHGAH